MVSELTYIERVRAHTDAGVMPKLLACAEILLSGVMKVTENVVGLAKTSSPVATACSL